jgi:hypothetical protein
LSARNHRYPSGETGTDVRTEKSSTPLNQVPTVRGYTRLGNPRLAGTTGPKDVDNVLGICVTVLCGDGFCPGFHSRGLNFLGETAFSADDVVMMARGTRAIEVLALSG